MRRRRSRRDPGLALALLLAASVATALGGCSDGGNGNGCTQLADGRCVTETFRNPAVLEPDADGVYQLELKPTEFSFQGQRHCGRGYNGLYPGPTIDIAKSSSGEPRRVRVNLRNRFTESDYRSVSESDDDVCTCTDTVTGAACMTNAHASHDFAHAHAAATDTCRCTDGSGNTCHVYDFNITNLHFHGAHVRPDYASGGGCTEHDGLSCRTCSDDRSSGARECFLSDDVLSHVGHGEGVQHRYDFDEDGVPPAGLSWYHPHIHGTTAIQVGGGAAGAYILRGDLDDIPGIKNARERVMVITTPPTTYTPLADGEPCDQDHITFDDFATLNATPGSNPQANLINGLERPRLLMPPGQIERWRILDASFLDEAQIALFRGKDSDCTSLDVDAGTIPLTQIGRDGIPLAKPADGKDWPWAPPYIFLSSGYRVEALLDGSTLEDGDTLCLMSARALQEDETGTTSEPVGRTRTPTQQQILTEISNGELIAIVNVTAAAGTPTETHMPDLSAVAAQSPSMMLQNGTVDALARCAVAERVTDVDRLDQLSALWMVFYNTSTLDQCGFDDHNINARNFESTDRTRHPYDRVMTKGSVEHWRVVSGFDGHPFHIHINPFVACPLPPEGSPSANTKGRLFEPPFAHWRDTYLVNLDRQADFITEYRAFAGTYVTHCHKLTHEDHGMMELIHVCDPEQEECESLCDGGPCRWDFCAGDDSECQRRLVATKCLFDAAYCDEAALRCTTCGEDASCPAGATCGAASSDGVSRCVPSSESSAVVPPAAAFSAVVARAAHTSSPEGSRAADPLAHRDHASHG
ncbi:multicopper oxidase domain-containing protein, partial [Candidatus Binatia bacterium]|nr:multicopper oxidase domain-containing protein [Candidatus Binatia bacterium]